MLTDLAEKEQGCPSPSICECENTVIDPTSKENPVLHNEFESFGVVKIRLSLRGGRLLPIVFLLDTVVPRQNTMYIITSNSLICGF